MHQHETNSPCSSHSPRTNEDAREQALVRQIATGQDATAFDTLTALYREPLRRFLHGQTDGDDAMAEDLLQETLLRLWTRADTFDGQGSVRGWLFRIAANLAANYRRTRSRRREAPPLLTDEEQDHPALGPEELLLREEKGAAVRRMLAELPEETREMLRLVHDEEWGLRDVAATLGIPEGTVKSRLYHTRRKLSRQWEAEEQ